jgi:hypothetical protein
MTFIFLKLSNVNIFPRADVHPKNITLEGAFNLQILFKGKGEPTRMDNA